MTTGSEARLTDAQKEAQRTAKSEGERKLALLKKDFNETFASAAGRSTLRKIMDICGYAVSPVVGDQHGNPLAEGTIYNAAQQNVYRAIRKLLKDEILIAVEYRGSDKDEVDIFS